MPGLGWGILVEKKKKVRKGKERKGKKRKERKVGGNTAVRNRGTWRKKRMSEIGGGGEAGKRREKRKRKKKENLLSFPGHGKVCFPMKRPCNQIQDPGK